MQPPQNPYEKFPGPNDPLPRQSVEPLGGSTPPRGPEISFDTISEAWTILQPNLGVWIGASLIYGLIVGLLSLLQNANLTTDASGMPHIGPLYFVFALLGFLAGSFFIGGLLRMAINNVRTGRAELGLLFSTVDVLPSLLGASILTTIAMGFGMLFCILPGLLLGALFLFVTPLIVDKRMGVFEAIGTSFNTLKPQMWMALLYVVVVGLIAYAGAIACGIGMLVTAPLALLAVAITYRDFFYGGSLPAKAPGYPTAPIADPRR